MKTFEDYLAEKHMEQFTGIKDQLPDAFDEWLCDLDPDTWILHATMWASGAAFELSKQLK